MEPSPRDLIIRISLVRGEDGEFEELSPSIWRRFKCSAHIDLDVFQDKIVQPVMGWWRNYHTYYFRSIVHKSVPVDVSVAVNFIQQKTNAADLIHWSFDNTKSRQPEGTKIGEILVDVGDEILYVYDLGDNWKHILHLEQIITEENGADGKCNISDGKMRCPNEDGEGCDQYQKEVLDLMNEIALRPNDIALKRKFANSCFESRHRSPNVLGIFIPTEFSVEKQNEALQDALRSRASVPTGMKLAYGLDGSPPQRSRDAGPGQIVQITKYQQYVGQLGGNDDNFCEINETLNVEPDDPLRTLCCACGNPLNLSRCAACMSAFYCSNICQKKEWTSYHRKKCKAEKQKIQLYANKKSFTYINAGTVYLKRFNPLKLRFHIGEIVECIVGEDLWVTGRIVNTTYREAIWPAGIVAPYQIHLDKKSSNRMNCLHEQALIYSSWDDDHYVRKIEIDDNNNDDIDDDPEEFEQAETHTDAVAVNID